MSVARRHALALLVATLAPRAAGEEATLASLTGLFQREPERAAALVASAREGARAINQSSQLPCFHYEVLLDLTARGGARESHSG